MLNNHCHRVTKPIGVKIIIIIIITTSNQAWSKGFDAGTNCK